MTGTAAGPLSVDLLDLAGCVLGAIGATPADVARARGDMAAAREALTLVVENPEVRAAVAVRFRASGSAVTPAVEALLGDDRGAAIDQLDRARTGIRARQDQVRRAEKAVKKGTPEERRIARLSDDVAEAKRGKAAAENRAYHFAGQVTTLTAQVAELSEALTDAESHIQNQRTATDAVRAQVGNPRALARNLYTVLQCDPTLLTAAGVVAPSLTGEELAKLIGDILAELADPRTGRALAAARVLSVVMLGGGVEVGGSCALVTAGDTRILVDVGTRPNHTDPGQMQPPGLATALTDGPVHAIVVTHAHADHAGWVPAVLAVHPDVPVYTTAPTADLLETMWADSAKIFTRFGPAAPYTRDDVRTALGAVRQVPFGHQVTVGDLRLELFPAGHVLGAAGVWVTDGTATAVVSGDVSGPGQLTVGGWALPPHATEPDLLVLESTYGAAMAHEARSNVIDAFVRDVQRTVAGGGRVLVPAFALGRAQEIALLVVSRLPDVPVLIDGLARDVTEVFERHPGVSADPLEIWSDQVQAVPRGHTSAAAARFSSGVVITTSGMLSAGPALTWAEKILPDPRSLLAVVGYQDPNSPGGKLLELDKSGGVWHLPARDDGALRPVDVAARVRRYGLGAHASADELVTIATQVRAKATMLVHGDPPARAALGARLTARHLAVVDAADPWSCQPGT